MPTVSGNVGAVFNGGTISQPLVIAVADPTKIPLQISASFAAISTDFFRILDTDHAHPLFNVDSAAYVNAFSPDGSSGGQFNGYAAEAPSGTTVQQSAGFNGLFTQIIESGALPTVTPSSGVAFQCTGARDVYLVVPCTLNPTAGAAATVKGELSPDNVTFSTLAIVTEPAGVALDGTVLPVSLNVPARWHVKLTATNATLGTGTYW